MDLPDEDQTDEDYSVLKAEADKLIADSQMAVRKVALWDDAEAQLEEANRIWKRSSSQT